MALRVKDSMGNLYDIPGEHFMYKSGSFREESVEYEIDFPVTQEDLEWLEFLSREDDLYPIADYIRFYTKIVRDTRKTFEYPGPGLIDSVIPESIYDLLVKLRKLGKPKKWIVELAKYFYTRDSFPNLSEIWKNRYAENFCATREYLDFIKNHKK